MHHRKGSAAAVCAALLLAGCGGGSSSSGIAGTPTQTFSASAGSLAATLTGAGSAGALALSLASGASGTLPCGVSVYHFEYTSVDGQGKPVSASAALMLPTGTGATCGGARPLLEYAHGTSLDQTYDIAALNDPTNPAYAEGLLVAAMYAAHGYVVIAPNYVGYDTSNASYHPYLIKAAQSQDMIDALAAGRQLLPQLGSGVSDDGKLFLTGYSQGGYVALATELAMQNAGMTVTAASPGSGPYALASTLDYIFMGHPDLGAPQLGSLLVQAYQDAYGNVYSSPSQVFNPGYTVQLPQPHFDSALLPATLPMFSSTAPTAADVTQMPADATGSPGATLDAVFADLVPPYGSTSTTPDAGAIQAKVWATLFDTNAADTAFDAYPYAFSGLWGTYFATSGYLINQTFRANYLADAVFNPDGFIAQTAQGPTQTATDGFRKDLAANDLRGEVPSAPTMLCGGADDPVVYYPLNTGELPAEWRPSNVYRQFALNLDSATPPTGGPVLPYASLINSFESWKNATLASGPSGPQTEVAQYHGVVGAYCAAAALQFFSGY